LATCRCWRTGGATLFESAAICLQLADRFPAKGLAPPLGTPERGQLYQWLFFAATELEPPVGALSAEKRKPEAERSAAAAEAAAGKFQKAVAALEPVLARSPYLLGDFSVADVVAGAAVLWGKSLGAYSGLPAVDAWADRLRARPAWKRAVAD